MRALLLMVFLAACGGGSLDRLDVENIPPGDAVGSGLSGAWSLTYRVTGCSGDCTTGTGEDEQVHCTVIDVPLGEDLEVVQQAGVLELLRTDGSSYLRGAANADGSFVVGTYLMSEGVEHMIRLAGTSSPTAMSGTLEGRIKDPVIGLDCVASAEASMTRL
jgi:hypothetical protein